MYSAIALVQINFVSLCIDSSLISEDNHKSSVLIILPHIISYI